MSKPLMLPGEFSRKAFEAGEDTLQAQSRATRYARRKGLQQEAAQEYAKKVGISMQWLRASTTRRPPAYQASLAQQGGGGHA